MFDDLYPVGDFLIESIDNDNGYRVVLFLNTNEPTWQGISDPAVYMYKYGMCRGVYIEKENAIEMKTGYDGVRGIIMYLSKYEGMEPGMINLMLEVLAQELESKYSVV